MMDIDHLRVGSIVELRYRPNWLVRLFRRIFPQPSTPTYTITEIDYRSKTVTVAPVDPASGVSRM